MDAPKPLLWPSEQDLFGPYDDDHRLPVGATVVLAARSARRALPIIRLAAPETTFETLRDVVDTVESLTGLARASESEALELRDAAYGASGEFFMAKRESRAAKAAAHAARAVGKAANALRLVLADYSRVPLEDCAREAVFQAAQAASIAAASKPALDSLEVQHEAWDAIMRNTLRDSGAALSYYARERQRSDLDFPKHLFSYLLSFDRQDHRDLVRLEDRFSSRLVRCLAAVPSLLYQLTPRDFEILIAQVLDGMGFDVELTAQSRDGGRDIIAISMRPTVVRYLIECKRFAPHNKVGLALVQRLHGVVEAEGATKGILATTSTFTSPAQDFLDRPNVTYRLEGRDIKGVEDWLVQYDRNRMLQELRRFVPDLASPDSPT